MIIFNYDQVALIQAALGLSPYRIESAGIFA
jgi:hypothetical protein